MRDTDALTLRNYEGVGVTDAQISIEAISDKKGRARFVDLGRAFAAKVENSVPQLRSEQLELVDPDKNPFFLHARAQLFIAHRDGREVGRISAHIDELALDMLPEQGFGPGTGLFGYFDAEDFDTAKVLLRTAEKWLHDEGMTKVLGPISMSIWEEPGLLVRGQDHPPLIMMGHHPAHFAGWIEACGYTRAKTLYTYDLDISKEFPPIVQRIVKSTERNEKIKVRYVRKSHWDEDAAIIVAMQRGTDMTVRGTSQLDTYSLDTYSLLGFTAAFNAMRDACPD